MTSSGYREIDTLRPGYREFFCGTILNGMSENDALTIVSFLEKHDETINRTIPMKVMALNSMRPSLNYVEANVLEGRALLRDYFRPKMRMLNNHGLVPVFYGSLLYGKPINLDFDLTVFGMKHFNHIASTLFYDVSNEINKIWPGAKHSTVEYSTIEKIDGHIKLLQNDSKYENVKKESAKIENDFALASIIFNGLPLFEQEQNQRYVNLREMYWRLICNEPLLSSVVVFELTSTILERQRRL